MQNAVFRIPFIHADEHVNRVIVAP